MLVMAWSPVRPFNAGRFEVETPRRLRHSQFLPTSRRHPVRDYTGMNMTDLPAQRPPSRLWDLYLRSVTERQPVAMLIPRLGHEEDPAYSVSILAAPLSSDGTVVDMLFGIVDFSRLRDEVLSKPVM